MASVCWPVASGLYVGVMELMLADAVVRGVVSCIRARRGMKGLGMWYLYALENTMLLEIRVGVGRTVVSLNREGVCMRCIYRFTAARVGTMSEEGITGPGGALRLLIDLWGDCTQCSGRCPSAAKETASSGMLMASSRPFLAHLSPTCAWLYSTPPRHRNTAEFPDELILPVYPKTHMCPRDRIC